MFEGKGVSRLTHLAPEPPREMRNLSTSVAARLGSSIGMCGS